MQRLNVTTNQFQLATALCGAGVYWPKLSERESEIRARVCATPNRAGRRALARYINGRPRVPAFTAGLKSVAFNYQEPERG